MRGKPILTPFRGTLHNLCELSRVTGIWLSTIGRWRRAGVLSEAWVEAYLEERAWLEKARSNGISTRLYRQRMLQHGWTSERAATEPPAKRSPRRHRGVATTPANHGVGGVARPCRASAMAERRPDSAWVGT